MSASLIMTGGLAGLGGGATGFSVTLVDCTLSRRGFNDVSGM